MKTLNAEHKNECGKAEYTDYKNRVCYLTNEELTYFKNSVEKVLSAVGVSIPVYTYNHEILPDTRSNALGIHWKHTENKDEFITIDNFFIHECYGTEFEGKYNITGETLVSVLCHELAHMKYRNHNKYHAALTAKYIAMIN